METISTPIVALLTLMNVAPVVSAHKTLGINNMPCINCGRDDIMSVDAGSIERPGQLCGTDDVTSSNFRDPLFSGLRVFCNPPPRVPDLFSVFSDTLLLHTAVMHNLTKRIFESESTCDTEARKSISALRGVGTESADCFGKKASGVPCRGAASAVLHKPSIDRLKTKATTTTTTAAPVEFVNLDREPYYGSLEDVGYDSWEPAVVVDPSRMHPHPDSRLQQPPAAAYQSTVSTSSRPSGQLASPFVMLWTTLHGKLLIIAVSISLVAAVVVLAVWISLRAKLTEPKYGEARATEEAVLMYGRVLRQTDEQRRTRSAAAPAPLLGDDVTPQPDGYAADQQHHQHHHHRPGQHRYQTAVVGHEIVSDELMSFSGQPVRRYL